jgi:hypothetical protein
MVYRNDDLPSWCAWFLPVMLVLILVGGCELRSPPIQTPTPTRFTHEKLWSGGLNRGAYLVRDDKNDSEYLLIVDSDGVAITKVEQHQQLAERAGATQ